ncbi:hypothetical protein G7B40_001855 [Aetokthonos hydrillicola Thurmond2011]|jgi:hypothetical protein|uniref:Uncharacterized protein n=1 Tax=Aetokthonos hydrillicola Thurmond2011 TaxID=2712845 RepID=A0AAP5M323_9CYAN|nr:hypothetical protein [Aetokthonos hydrillicola]MBO3462790.1 hypothetical protein [Aetokthonos hydrillicola CCALA 1050]MBW4590187.1 hypothetical protein [Aetokthonos hydrillicola CCALA 1050]MDR9893331.1 hypothetical protein [Aetokthonos hydrillicola Thurmond2011]
MLVIVTEEQILTPRQVCQSCLLADKSGQPRWLQGQLGCGRAVSQGNSIGTDQYECVMGFRIVNIE